MDEKLFLLDRVWDMYNLTCMRGRMADYDDMVIQATELVRSGGPFGKRYTNVLVDEYQDVSPTLVDLLKAIRSRVGFRLFCVGDDWQSIYSFSGGDVWQFYDFESIWEGFGTISVSRIETTYRCPQTLVDLSGRFVSANPMQQRKDVKGVRDPPFRPVQLLPVNSDRDIPRAVANRLDFIDPSESVFIIGRTRADIYALGYGNGQFAFSVSGQSGSVDIVYRRWEDDEDDWVDVRPVRFLTAHSSKGLEADNVFVIADRDRGGFPNTVSDELSDLFERRDEGIPMAESGFVPSSALQERNSKRSARSRAMDSRRRFGSTRSTASTLPNSEQSSSCTIPVRKPHSMISICARSSLSRMDAMVFRPNRQSLI